MMKRKILICLLVLVLGLSFGFVGMGTGKAEAKLKKSGNWSYYVLKDGTVEIYEFHGNKKKVGIPEKIDGKLVSSICYGNMSFGNCDKYWRDCILCLY